MEVLRRNELLQCCDCCLILMVSSLTLIHQTSHRWRFKISQADKLDWKQLEADLQASFPRSSWSLRINSVACSIVITYKTCHQQIAQVTTFLVRDRLVQQINKQGLSISEIPLSETEVVGQVPHIGVRFPNTFVGLLMDCQCQCCHSYCVFNAFPYWFVWVVSSIDSRLLAFDAGHNCL